VAQALGFLSPQQYTHVADAGVEAEIENMGLKVENDALRTAVSLLSDHRCFKPVRPDIAGNSEGAKQAQDIPGNVVESGKSEGPDNAEPDDGKGLSDVRGNAASDTAESGKPASAKRRSGGSILDELV